MADYLRMSMEGNWEAGLNALGDLAKTGLLRSGGNAMSETFQEEAKLRAPVFAGPRTYVKTRNGGGYWVTPGQLRDSIYRVYSRSRSDGSRAVYEVSWNHTKAPHGHWMEYGNSRHAAHPFIRPAYDAAAQRAVDAGLARMSLRYAQAMQDLTAALAP